MVAVRRSARVWIPVTAALVVVLVLVLLASHGSSRADAASRLQKQSTINRVAHRVEAIRGLKFKRIPRVKVVTAKQLDEEQSAESSKLSPAEQATEKRAEQNSAAGAEAYKLVGILPATFDPSKGGGGGASDLLGLYDPKINAVRLVRESIDKEPKLAESTLAHELDHALELQNFGDRSDRLDPVSEKGAGYKSLQEGAATVVEYQYAKRYLGARKPLREFLSRDTFVGNDPSLPQALKDSVAFPYRQGGLFIDALVNEAGSNSFKLVDEAQKRPPESTAEILHPDLWRSHTTPERVALHGGDVLRGGGWKRLGGTDYGEFDTAALLRLAGSRSKGGEAAEGWAGGSFELWRQGDATKACKQPCRSREALVIGWRWHSASEANQEAKLIPAYLKKLDAQEEGGGVWKLKQGYAAFDATGTRSALVFAPTAEQAKQLLAGAL